MKVGSRLAAVAVFAASIGLGTSGVAWGDALESQSYRCAHRTRLHHCLPVFRRPARPVATTGRNRTRTTSRRGAPTRTTSTTTGATDPRTVSRNRPPTAVTRAEATRRTSRKPTDPNQRAPPGVSVSGRTDSVAGGRFVQSEGGTWSSWHSLNRPNFATDSGSSPSSTASTVPPSASTCSTAASRSAPGRRHTGRRPRRPPRGSRLGRSVC